MSRKEPTYPPKGAIKPDPFIELNNNENKYFVTAHEDGLVIQLSGQNTRVIVPMILIENSFKEKC